MSEQPPQYQIGQIVNGHRWTGTVWEPVSAPSPQMLGQPVPPTVTAPNKAWYKKWWGVGLLAFGALVLMTAIFGGGGDDTTAAGEPAATETSAAQEPVAEEPVAEEPVAEEPVAEEPVAEEPVAEEPVAEEPVAGIGDAVRDGKFEFTVTDVRTGVPEVGNEFLSEKAQGQYTLVSMKVENIGDEAQTFFSDNVKGTDSKDREVSSDSTATLYANEDNTGWIEEINPGNAIEAIVVFDLAKGAKLVVVELHDSAFSGGTQVSLK